ncbi:hypothetical protein MHSWG343_06000 [Candidatus Mycoplasma haematohominis]|uniref:Uncharacterized protein n=1 Tax=Candidatus Mycoplasma haematohominis TaxID=1494318 RepID=A0A478FQ94_9MOLU|nr:hypothetical protein MHSWG343_06000 [Candidatus Mycoplasma haemohominis]
MLRETKITIVVSGVAGNATLGVSGYEFLKVYFLNQEISTEVEAINNEAVIKITTYRKRSKEKTFESGTDNKFDLREIKNTSPKIVKHPHDRRHKTSSLRHINQEHRSQLVSWEKDNKQWWENTYKQREYMIKNQKVSPKITILGAYNDTNVYMGGDNEPLHMNQFCDKGYGRQPYFKKYKQQFWLMCTINGKNPDNDVDSQEISTASKARFPESGSNKKEITYLNFEQSKKEDPKNTQVKENKSKFVIYDYSQDWWDWSFNYRLKVDKEDETSAFPLTEKFKQATSGWDENVSSANALNKICKDFYEQSGTTSQDEIDDAWRYCSDEGKKNQ